MYLVVHMLLVVHFRKMYILLGLLSYIHTRRPTNPRPIFMAWSGMIGKKLPALIEERI